MIEIKERCDAKISSFTYRFSEEERKHLKLLLDGYDKNAVEIFLKQLEIDFSLLYYGQLDSNQETKAGRAKNRCDKISEFESTLKRINRISPDLFCPVSFPKCICQDDLLRTINPDLNYSLKFKLKIKSNIEAVCQSLQKVINDLRSTQERQKVKRGSHPKADELDLAFVIGKEFIKHIGHPRPYTGPFYSIVEYCYEIIRNPCPHPDSYTSTSFIENCLKIRENKKNDRTWAVRQALKKLSSSYPSR